ncbi:MAG: coenzyme F420-0:L-glutamate ligase [Nitrosopumilaceae archaeon]|uniref:Coenzyme F420-0:L-glutamate ligase n=1 Tax=Candidatus Nitrosomaritimum aestuariumsis TaxID=3342354 RepID=A0AC60WBG0_9ARCH|nr:coenzyme F420-0:L-glutamate ligase [Nitrosopumilaceae archaeon]MBA4464239.1 coenzyme F420-0:L-glutamate ligase [Nitrosopumilaceae archaeon]
MQVIPVHISNEIEVNDDLAELILSSQEIKEGDILVIAQKIISKQEGRIIELSKIEPSLLAQGIASQYNKDPRIVELILSESKKIVRMQNGVIIVETNHGFICANAGIDESNVKDGFVTLLPVDSDLSAKKIRDGILNKTRKNIAVVVSDTFGRPFRNGQTNCAIGLSGITPILDYAGTQDAFGNILRVTAIAISDEIASTAELVMGKNNKCPVAIIRDYKFSNESENISEIIRPENEDLFR